MPSPKITATVGKNFPENFSSDIVRILNTFSFTNGDNIEVLGSMGLRSQQYASDYDGYEQVNLHYKNVSDALSYLANKFQSIIKKLSKIPHCYVGDIKCGAKDEWRVITNDCYIDDKNEVRNYDSKKAHLRVYSLFSQKVIKKNELEESIKLLPDEMTAEDLVRAKKYLKFHIVRWTPEEVAKGHKILRDGSKFTLEDGFQSPGITKVDAIALVESGRYAEFSVIYSFRNNGVVLNNEPIDAKKSLIESIVSERLEGNPFKVLKRKLSLARINKDETLVKKYTEILNSDLGRLYLVLSDVGTLIQLLQNESRVPLIHIRREIDQFKNRLANVYSAEEYLKNEKALLKDIDKALSIDNRQRLITRLLNIEDRLFEYLKSSVEARGSGRKPSYKPLSKSAGL